MKLWGNAARYGGLASGLPNQKLARRYVVIDMEGSREYEKMEATPTIDIEPCFPRKFI